MTEDWGEESKWGRERSALVRQRARKEAGGGNSYSLSFALQVEEEE